MNKKVFFLFAFFLAAATFFNGILAQTGDNSRDTRIARNLDIFNSLFKELNALYVDTLDIPTVPGTVVKTTVLNDSISEVMLSNGVKVVLWKKQK